MLGHRIGALMHTLFWLFATASVLFLALSLLLLWVARDFVFDPRRHKRKGQVFLSFHRKDHRFAKQIASILEQHEIKCCVYEPDGFTDAVQIDRDIHAYGEHEEYWDAIRRDPRSTAVFYYRNFVYSSCLVFLNPRHLKENSSFVQAELQIASSLNINIYEVDTADKLITLLPNISEERIPWPNQPESMLLLDKLRNHLEDLYKDDQALQADDAYIEIQSLYDRGGFMQFDVALDPVERQIMAGCLSVVLMALGLIGALAALLINWIWL